MKVFLLGLDGMTLRVVEPYVEAGLLPNFKKVLEGGVYGDLCSTIPPFTGPAWMSLATGKNPGKHGVYEFRRREGYTTKLVTKNTSPHAEPIWSILSRNGKKVVVVNVPFTYPPDEVNGVMVSGMMTPDINTDFVFPKNLRKKVFELIPDYQIDIGQQVRIYSRDKDALLRKIFKITEDRRKLMHYFLDHEPWDMFFITFVGPDRLQHFMWDEVTAMEPECVRYYQVLDDILGDIMTRLDDDTVLLMVSDHGFTAAKKVLHINNLFSELGLLHVRRNWKRKNTGGIMSAPFRVIKWGARRTGLIHVKEKLPRSVLNRIKTLVRSREFTEASFDPSRTKVFSMVGCGMACINLKGREPQGIVKKEDRGELFEEIKKKLLEFKDPATGETIVKDVVLCDRIYSPECTEGRPDLLVVTEEGYLVMESLGEDILGDTRWGQRCLTGGHAMNGLFAAYGSNINSRRCDAHIFDVMPTVLYLTGSSIPEDVDGRVLSEIIDGGYLERNEIRFQKGGAIDRDEATSLSEGESKQVEDHLRNLGYLG